MKSIKALSKNHRSVARVAGQVPSYSTRTPAKGLCRGGHDVEVLIFAVSESGEVYDTTVLSLMAP